VEGGKAPPPGAESLINRFTATLLIRFPERHTFCIDPRALEIRVALLCVNLKNRHNSQQQAFRGGAEKASRLYSGTDACQDSFGLQRNIF
jgi:hypothetical protein